MKEDKELIRQEGVEPEENEVNLLELAQKLWADRKFLIRFGVIGLVVGLVVAFSIPKEYTSSVKLAPEINDPKAAAGGLSSLASLAGINLGGGGAGADAVYPQLYPDIVSSIPFTVGLFDVEVTDSEGNRYTVRQYLEDETSGPWWGAVLSLPGKAIGGVMSLFRDDETYAGGDSINPFRLTVDEDLLVKALGERIGANVDTKTSVISISVMMQDPLVSAMLADTVVTRLQQYITDYRTNKARKDMAYATRINEEARADYYAAQQKYAEYVDKNQGVTLRSGKTEEERLQNETNLAFDLYNATSQRLQQAKAKVQELAPVYTVVQPSTVPIRPSKPSKVMILIGFIFLAVVIAGAWVLYGRELVKSFKSIKNAPKE